MSLCSSYLDLNMSTSWILFCCCLRNWRTINMILFEVKVRSKCRVLWRMGDIGKSATVFIAVLSEVEMFSPILSLSYEYVICFCPQSTNFYLYPIRFYHAPSRISEYRRSLNRSEVRHSHQSVLLVFPYLLWFGLMFFVYFQQKSNEMYYTEYVVLYTKYLTTKRRSCYLCC